VTDFETKDSGERQQWQSGMMRDTQKGKPRFALMWTKLQPYEDQMLTRYARLLARGAEKYEDRNWEEGSGQEELDYAYESLSRHTAQLICGERDEDHAAAVWFNTQLIEYLRWRMEQDSAGKGYEYESDVRHEALKRAAEMRKKERLAEGAQQYADDSWLNEMKPEEKDPIIDVNDNGTPFRQSDLTKSKSGAVGLFQFMDPNWSKDFDRLITRQFGQFSHRIVPSYAKPVIKVMPDWTDEQREKLTKLLKKWGIDPGRLGV